MRRKNLYLFCAAVVMASTNAPAWNVSTGPTNRSALIEEFTGIQCQNCPDGHRVAANLMARHPEQVYSVAIHAGYFSEPHAQQPDFRTAVGTTVHDFFQITSYPCAVVNRMDLGSGTVLGRSYWGAACREATKLASPVNLWSESIYDDATRTLSVNVEGYFTADMDEARLNVFLLQSEIAGPQSGGQLGEEYPHRHMLRSSLAEDNFGDVIDNSKAGEYFTKSFTLTLPEKFEEIASDIVNTEVLVFVTDKAGEVCQVSATRPDTSALTQQLIVSYAAAPIAIDKNYAFDYVEAILFNHGGVEVTEAGFELTVNGNRKEYSWEGSVKPHSAELIKVPVGEAFRDVCEQEGNSYKLRLLTANKTEVETPSISGSFNEIVEYPTKLSMYIKTDLNAGDNNYRILDSDGEVVKEFGPFPEGEITEFTGDVELEDGKLYCLEVADAWGDGICHPLGNVKLYDAAGKQIAQYKEIRDNGMRQFFRATNPSGITDAALDVTCAEYYDVAGRRLSGASGKGVSIVRTLKADGSISVSKILR